MKMPLADEKVSGVLAAYRTSACFVSTQIRSGS
jgi:hypothetical protein